MRKYTYHDFFYEFLEADNFCSEAWQLLEQKTVKELNKHVDKHTHFKTWNDMLLKASEYYLLKDLV